MGKYDKETAMQILYGNRRETKKEEVGVDRETARAVLFGNKKKQLKHYIKFYYTTHPEFDDPAYYEIHEISSRDLKDIVLPSYCEKFDIFDAYTTMRLEEGRWVNYGKPFNLNRYFIAKFENCKKLKDGGLFITGRKQDGAHIYVDETDILIDPELVVKVDGGIMIDLNKNYGVGF